MQPLAEIFQNALHDVVAAETARCGLFVGAFLSQVGFHIAGLQSGRIRILGQNPVLIKNLSCGLRIPVQLIHQHIPESDCLVSGFFFASILLVGEVASQSRALAVYRDPPALEVRVCVGESGDVTQIHSKCILCVQLLDFNLY